jgi:NADPH2:quinone reductase
VTQLGDAVTGFKEGDRVFWAGELRRQGTYAEYQAVDHRIVGHLPESLDLAPSAALPLTSLTAYEAIFQRLRIPKTGAGKVLIIGGAGGVGSIAIQILRAETDAEVYATAGREDSKAWAKKMGAHYVVERSAINLDGESPELPQFDYIFSTTNSDSYLKAFPFLLKPGGHLCLIDDPESFNIREFKLRSQTVSWELMFTPTLFDHDRESQGRILDRIGELAHEGRIVSTMNTRFDGMSPENLIAAHRIQESGGNIGKTVVAY